MEHNLFDFCRSYDITKEKQQETFNSNLVGTTNANH
jgi:hypothetical protein